MAGQTATQLGGDTTLAARITQSNSAMEAFEHAIAAGIDLPTGVAEAAWKTAAQALSGEMRLEVVIFDRSGQLLRAHRVSLIPRQAAVGPEAALIVGIVQRAVAKSVGAEDAADQDQRGALDRRRPEQPDDGRKRPTDHPLVRP